MKFSVLPVLLLTSALAAAPLLPPAPGGNSSSFVLRGGQPDLAWTICDAVNAPEVVVVDQPDQAGRSEVSTFSKIQPGVYSYQAYRLGQADPGAGQVYYSLTPRDGQAGGSGAVQPGNVHAVNPGMLDHPRQVLTPPVTSLSLPGGQALRCRWLPGTRLLGFTARRSFTVTQDASGRLTYQSYDFASAPAVQLVQPGGVSQSSASSLTVTGGQASSAGGTETFTFNHDGYRYSVRVDDRGNGSLSVARGGRVIQTERLTGYTHAVPR